MAIGVCDQSRIISNVSDALNVHEAHGLASSSQVEFLASTSVTDVSNKAAHFFIVCDGHVGNRPVPRRLKTQTRDGHDLCHGLVQSILTIHVVLLRITNILEIIERKREKIKH